MSAIRLARGFTGRDVVVKFAGCYHGHVDSLLASAGSGARHVRACPARPGVPESSTALTLVLPYNDRAAVEQAFAEHGDRIACLITEAAPGNMGVVPPEPGLQRVPRRDLRRHGALFVSDEVMTGFRASPLRASGASTARVEGWRPDLMTFGKVMGGGFPAAAFGGRADVMAHLAPEGPVYQAGTLSGNPVATTAGLATLRLATDEVYAHLDRRRRRDQGRGRRGAHRGRRPPRRAGDRHDVLGLLHRRGPVPRLRRTPRAPTRRRTPRSSTPCSTAGVYLPPSAYEAWFLSAAHDDRAVQTVLDALPDAARAAAAPRRPTR